MIISFEYDINVMTETLAALQSKYDLTSLAKTTYAGLRLANAASELLQRRIKTLSLSFRTIRLRVGDIDPIVYSVMLLHFPTRLRKVAASVCLFVSYSWNVLYEKIAHLQTNAFPCCRDSLYSKHLARFGSYHSAL
jgi:hypothetical protein